MKSRQHANADGFFYLRGYTKNIERGSFLAPGLVTPLVALIEGGRAGPGGYFQQFYDVAIGITAIDKLAAVVIAGGFRVEDHADD